MIINGKIEAGTVENFFRTSHGTDEEHTCELFKTGKHVAKEEKFDLASFNAGPARVECEIYDGDAAYGVTKVTNT